jgi:hypothetical protein
VSNDHLASHPRLANACAEIVLTSLRTRELGHVAKTTGQLGMVFVKHNKHQTELGMGQYLLLPYLGE